jgi:hypothetical protein
MPEYSNPHGIPWEHYIPGESNRIHHVSCTVDSPSLKRVEDWAIVDCGACLVSRPLQGAG